MALDVLAGEIGDVLDGRAEARRTDHRAVAARQTALGDVVPARVLVVAVEQLADVGDVDLATHLRGRARMCARRRLALVVLGTRMAKITEHVGATLAADLEHEV